MAAHSELLRDAQGTLYRTLDENPTLAPEVAQRIDRLENFQLEGNMLSFTLERHPHILGRQSKGMASPGFFIIEERYAFDLVQKTITLTWEQCTGWEADVDALAYEDVHELLDGGGLDPAYTHCTSEDEVRTRAESEVDGIVEAIRDSQLVMPDLLFGFENKEQIWGEFCDDFAEQWRLNYVELVIEKWKEWKEDDEDFA